MLPTNYQFDVFISYKRGGLIESWASELFQPFLFEALKLELDYDPAIFRDDRLVAGDDWKRRLRGALLASRCIVPIWSPDYFRSAWCLAEWEAFRKRAALADADLVVPVQWHDGERYPKEARAAQWGDFRKFAYVGSEAFQKSERFLDYQDAIRVFAAALAAKIASAPTFDADWPADIPDDERTRPAVGISRPMLAG